MSSREAVVEAVSFSPSHEFSKVVRKSIMLVAGLGVEGDAHAGMTVQHLSRIKQDPAQLNLRQIHLIHVELHDELRASGFTIAPGDLGENLLTRGIDLLALPTGTRLSIGEEAMVQITGLRNPCAQIEKFQAGMLRAVLGKDRDGNLIRKAGVMGIVLASGEVSPGDRIVIQLPPARHMELAPV